MRVIKYLLLLLIPAVVLAQVTNVYSPVRDSTIQLDCTDSSGTSSRTEISGGGPQLHFNNRGNAPAFVKWGGSTVEAGTSSTVIGPGPLLMSRDPVNDTHIACLCASGESTTIHVETGYGE